MWICACSCVCLCVFGWFVIVWFSSLSGYNSVINFIATTTKIKEKTVTKMRESKQASKQATRSKRKMVIILGIAVCTHAINCVFVCVYDAHKF